jgi:lysophospholipase L1-like esterase
MRGLLRVLMVCVASVGAASSAQTAAVPVAPAPSVDSLQKKLAVDEAKLMDWAQLDHFRVENAALAAPAAGERRVVFYGDSITAHWAEGGYGFFPGKPYVGRGISGQTSAQMVVRFHQDVVDLRAAAVVILAGTNDVAENTGPMTPEMTMDNFRSMVEMARANAIKVVICSIPPAGDFPWRHGLEPAGKIRALNARLEAWAKSEGFVWVDYYSALADASGAMKPGVSLDGVHPNAAGYAIMTPLAEAGIAKALGR